MPSESAETDVLGPPYSVEILELRPDDEGAVDASLVHLGSTDAARAAVLHVHGFCDYFFHTEYAEWWAARGFDFYALDLRKYGRSLRPHQTPGYVEDLGEYYEELDLAWAAITERDGHRDVVISAHSTGGLTAALWCHDRKLPLAGLVLNSPWLDMGGPFWVRLGSTVAGQLGSYQPKRELPKTSPAVFGRTLHRDHGGEWDYDLDWKPIESWSIYAGWVRAVRLGQAQLQAGLDVQAPVLVLASGATLRTTEPVPEAHTHDVVLDVGQIRRWAPEIGRHVTVVSIEGARHDVVLSLPEPRARVYDQLHRWLEAYVSRHPSEEYQ